MGCNHNLCVSVTGIKDAFALEGEALTAEYTKIALGAAFHPYLVDGDVYKRQFLHRVNTSLSTPAARTRAISSSSCLLYTSHLKQLVHTLQLSVQVQPSQQALEAGGGTVFLRGCLLYTSMEPAEQRPARRQPARLPEIRAA